MTVASGQHTSATTSVVTAQKTGSNGATVTMTFSDGLNSFTASLTID